MKSKGTTGTTRSRAKATAPALAEAREGVKAAKKRVRDAKSALKAARADLKAAKKVRKVAEARRAAQVAKRAPRKRKRKAPAVSTAVDTAPDADQLPGSAPLAPMESGHPQSIP